MQPKTSQKFKNVACFRLLFKIKQPKRFEYRVQSGQIFRKLSRNDLQRVGTNTWVSSLRILQADTPTRLS